MTNEEELKNEIARLRQEIERMKFENLTAGQKITKKKAEVAGEMTSIGIFEEEVKKTDLSKGIDKEEVKVTHYFSPKGHILEKGKVFRCSFCSMILTDKEKIEIKNKVFCEDCYRKNEHDLDKDDYKILVCVSNGFRETSMFFEYFGNQPTIQRLTGINNDEVESMMRKLIDNDYLFYYSYFFTHLRVSAKGEEALVAYKQVYHDEDIDLMNFRISRWS